MKLSLALSLALVLIPSLADAQELAPRAYWPIPKGTSLVVVGYQFSSGDVVTDPSLPIEGVDSNTNFVQVTYQYTTSFFGRSANVQLNVPYAWGTSEGFAEGQTGTRDISGLADARFRMSVNLLGVPSMDPAGFQALRANPRTIIGASLLIQAPTGEYESGKLINAGSNRWAVKPALGLIWPMRPKWLLELDIGAWIYGDNDEFLGLTKEQEPIWSAEMHLIKRIQPGFWASLDANYYFGGRTTVDDTLNADLQGNSRVGATFAFPLKGRHGFKANFSTGVAVQSGGEYDSFAVNYFYSWR